MSFNYTISLDPEKRDKQTKRFDLPLLAVPAAKIESLYVDEEELPNGQFEVGRNYLKIDRDFKDTSKIKAIMSFNHLGFRSRFWGPIIVAAITSLAGILTVAFDNFSIFDKAEASQPIVEILHWAYCPDKHEFRTAISFSGISEELASSERLWVAIRTKDKTTSAPQDDVNRAAYSYKYFKGPFELKSRLIVVDADQDFSSIAEMEDKVVEGVYLSVDPAVDLPPTFIPSENPSQIQIRFHKWDGKKQCAYG